MFEKYGSQADFGMPQQNAINSAQEAGVPPQSASI